MDENFNKAQEKIEAFKEDLIRLKEKYNFGIVGLEQYDSNEDYERTEYFFVVDGFNWWDETVDEIINELKPNDE